AVRSGALRVPVPVVRVPSVGSAAYPSVLVKFTALSLHDALPIYWSLAVTVKVKALPAVALLGALTVKEAAAAALTLMALLVPVMVRVTVSVAVSVWLPAVAIVGLKVPMPLVRVPLGGSTAWPSVL